MIGVSGVELTPATQESGSSLRYTREVALRLMANHVYGASLILIGDSKEISATIVSSLLMNKATPNHYKTDTCGPL